MKAEVLAYLRYRRQFPLVAVEAFDADVMGVDERGLLWEVEVKVTLGDLRADAQKWKHVGFASLCRGEPVKGITPNYFSFALPAPLCTEAEMILAERYPYAGLISVHHEARRKFFGNYVASLRSPKRLHARAAEQREIDMLVKAMSASLACAYARIVRSIPA